ncbi:hypothetical protein A2U01_0017076, partial [Trifolium medium]|nr:hypothetical protein [Trifolium medium]
LQQSMSQGYAFGI